MANHPKNFPSAFSADIESMSQFTAIPNGGVEKSLEALHAVHFHRRARPFANCHLHHLCHRRGCSKRQSPIRRILCRHRCVWVFPAGLGSQRMACCDTREWWCARVMVLVGSSLLGPVSLCSARFQPLANGLVMGKVWRGGCRHIRRR